MKPLKPSDIGLRSDGFAIASNEVSHRIIASVEALEKQGKCLDGNSLVPLKNGKMKTISELRAGETLALGHKVEATRYDGIRPTFTIRTSDRRIIRATAKHRFLTPAGWQTVKQLREDMLIAVPDEIPIFGDDDVPTEIPKVIGYLLADGGLTGTSMNFTKGDEVVMKDFCDSVIALGFRVSERSKRPKETAAVGVAGGYRTHSQEFRDRWALRGAAASKHLEDSVFTWKREHIATLLNRYFTCDGWVCASKTGPQIGFCSASEKMLYQIMHLLLRFGIMGRTRVKVVNGKPYYSWETRTSGARQFVDKIGFFGQKQRKALKILKSFEHIRPYRNGSLNYDGILPPTGMVWTDIRSVEKGLYLPVYDLQVRGCAGELKHTFIANDILTHNSHWGLHAQSPIVLFNFDRGTDGVVQTAMRDGKQIVVAGMPLSEEDKKKHRLPSYSFHKPLLKPGQASKDTSYVTEVASRARAAWKKFRDDYEEALNSEARTLVIDTGTGAYELARYAAFGKLTQVMPLEYSRVNGEFQGILHRGYDFDKNILWIHRLKPQWVEKEDAMGRSKSEKTGQLERAGYRDIGFEVQMNLRLAKERDKKGRYHYTTTVLDCRLNSGLDGEVLRDEMSSFQFLAASVFENDPEEWE